MSELLPFKDIHNGERIILLGPGPTLNDFNDNFDNNIKRACVNGVILHNKFINNLDYYFWSGDLDIPEHPTPSYNYIIDKLPNLNKNTVKFCNTWIDNNIKNSYFFNGIQTQISPELAKNLGFICYNVLVKNRPNNYYFKDLSEKSSGVCIDSVAFSSIQILLYMGFREIILVGFDCIGNHSYSINSEYSNDICDWNTNNNGLVDMWKKFKNWINIEYNNVNISVIKPVGLKNIFNEYILENKSIIKCLAVLLFHNDEDLVEEQINYYKYLNNHDLIVFNHNSTDNTSNIIEKYKNDILCIYTLTSEINFKKNEVHETIYKILMGNDNINKNAISISNNIGFNIDYKNIYDWISFPESDEFIEGPDRTKSYYDHLKDLHENKKINYIYFTTYTYWFTEKDDIDKKLVTKRLKYYCINILGLNGNTSGNKIYAWRANKTKIRMFGHGSISEDEHEMVKWKTRHYEFRSKKQFQNKIQDRVNLIDIQKGNKQYNSHYYQLYKDYMNNNIYDIKSSDLHYDNGNDELSKDPIFNWKIVYSG